MDAARGIRRLVRFYKGWRGFRLWRQGSFVIGMALTIFSLLVLPGQWIPVLFRDDLTVIGLSLVILGVGTIAATASLARRGAFEASRAVLQTTGSGLLLVLLATVLYKTAFNGIGWPEAHEIGLALVFLAACVLMGGATGTASRRLPRWVSSLATLLTVVLMGSAGVWLYSGSLQDNLEPTYRASAQRCEWRNAVRYCANPGYEPFVDHWQSVVESILEAAPVDVGRSKILVAQLLDQGRRVEGAAAAPGLDWGKGAGESIAALGLGLDLANWVTGLDVRSVRFDPEEPLAMCDAGTNARSVVAYWLTGQISDEVAATIAELGCCADAINGSTFAAPSVGGGWDVARQLLELPESEARARMTEHWDELVDPDTPIARVHEIFALEEPEITQEEGDEQFPACASRYD